MTDEQYTGIKNNITIQSKKLQDMIGRNNNNFLEMYHLLSSITSSADAMFNCLDTAFSDDDKKSNIKREKGVNRTKHNLLLNSEHYTSRYNFYNIMASSQIKLNFSFSPIAEQPDMREG